MVVEMRDDAFQQSTHVLEDVEFSRALFELYEGGVVRVSPQPKVNDSIEKLVTVHASRRIVYRTS